MAEESLENQVLALRRQLEHAREDHRSLVGLLTRSTALLSALLTLAAFLVPFAITRDDGPFWLIQMPLEITAMGGGPRKGEAALVGALLGVALLPVLAGGLVEATLARRTRGIWQSPMVKWAPWLLMVGLLPYGLLALVVQASDGGDAAVSFPALALGIAAIPPAFLAQALAGHLDRATPPSGR